MVSAEISGLRLVTLARNRGDETMTSDDFVDRYVAMWNDRDAEQRKKTIAELFTHDGANYTRSLASHGLDQLQARVTAAYDHYVGTGDHIFRLATTPSAHHDVMKLTWEMVRVDTGDVAQVGLEFLVLDDEGRIRCDYQFLDS
jgi:hypothetical protein